MDYRNCLHALRMTNEFTQKEIAEYLEISQSAYCNFEKGKKDLTIQHLIKLKELYKVDYNLILG